MEEIIKFWRNFDANVKPPYIHKEDKSVIKLENHLDVKSHEDYLKLTDFGNIKAKYNYKLHLNLLPIPFSGDISNAKIYILLLNPGYSSSNYYEESDINNNLKNSIIKNIHQKFDKDEEYPLLWLNPNYLWTAGGQWVEKKFKPLLQYLVNEKSFKYIEALNLVSKKVCILELVPYHSQSFGLKSKELKIKSVEIMKKFVQNTLVAKAKNDDICIIQTRSIKEWGLNLPEHKNIIIYSKGQRRSASLSEKSEEAWKVMTEFIDK